MFGRRDDSIAINENKELDDKKINLLESKWINTEKIKLI